MEPTFLTLEVVLFIHAHQIAKYGGRDGILNQGMLDSALAMPKQTFAGQFVHDSIFKMAAAYAFHIAQDQPFNDGNKRTGAVAARVFLRLNGWSLNPPPQEFGDFMLALATHEKTKDDLANFFEMYSVKC